MIQFLVEEALRAVALEHDARTRERQHNKAQVAGAQARARAALEQARRGR